MRKIQKKFIVDSRNRKVAVQIDYRTFSNIEEILENCAVAGSPITIGVN